MILQDILFAIGGLAILLLAGDLLIRGAVGAAAALGVPSLLIGLTIVAFGTSAPELVVSIQAALGGENGIAVGNIIGSNIANILLVLGLPAIFTPMLLASPGLRRHTVVMLVATGVFAYIVYGPGVLDPMTGGVLTLFILIYIGYVAISAMRPDSPDRAAITQEMELEEQAGKNGFLTVVFLLVGLIGLPLGATLLVHSGSDLARVLGVREELIGLTIVAFGTSLPELAAVWAAARRGEAPVAVGNVIGSNIFNIFFVGGAMGLASFENLTTFTPEAARYDIPAMILAAILLAVLVFARARISRTIGIGFVFAYVAYVYIIGAGAVTGLPL